MAKQIARRDVVSGNKAVAAPTDKTAEEVLAAAKAHAKTKADPAMLEIPSDVVAKVKAAIRDR
jgi:predicted small metal-binding protein